MSKTASAAAPAADTPEEQPLLAASAEPACDASQAAEPNLVDAEEFRTCGGSYNLDPETGLITLIDRTLPPSF